MNMTRVGVNTVRVSMDQTQALPKEKCMFPDLTGLHLSTEELEKLQALLHKHRAVCSCIIFLCMRKIMD